MPQDKTGDGSKAQSLSDDDLDQVVGGSPIPYPSGIGGGGGGGKTVTADAGSGSSLQQSSGDEAGSKKGIVSSKN